MMFYAASIALILDRLTKHMAVSKMIEGRSVEVLPGVLNLTLVLNKGAAFGLFKHQTMLFAALSVLVIIFIIYYTLSKKMTDRALLVALGLVLGGAVGNLIDRVRLGYVIDFLDVGIWPVFNIADSCITAGAALLILKMFLRKTDNAPHIS
ncbi:MAG: signal peptidase II [Candidatus Omnitrophota bacterium]